jgi:hypothetical protein
MGRVAHRLTGAGKHPEGNNPFITATETVFFCTSKPTKKVLFIKDVPHT